jgi:hypothetical protein
VKRLEKTAFLGYFPGPEINQILNENWQDVLKDLGAPIQETVTTIIESIVSKILDKVPEKYILPE